jgi:hypothetical protein
MVTISSNTPLDFRAETTWFFPAVLGAVKIKTGLFEVTV